MFKCRYLSIEKDRNLPDKIVHYIKNKEGIGIIDHWILDV